jgi:hypothetical protein
MTKKNNDTRISKYDSTTLKKTACYGRWYHQTEKQESNFYINSKDIGARWLNE